jgi:hypothetical protein
MLTSRAQEDVILGRRCTPMHVKEARGLPLSIGAHHKRVDMSVDTARRSARATRTRATRTRVIRIKRAVRELYR